MEHDVLRPDGDGPETPAPADTTLLPRFPEMPGSLDAEQAELYARIASGPRGAVRGPLGLMLYSPGLATHAQALGEYARYNSMFPPALSELIILTVARHNDCHYEWAAHAPIAARAGVPQKAIDDIARGRRPQLDDADQKLVYDFANQLQEGKRVPKPLFERFRARFGERGVVEASGIMGYYSLVAFMLNAAEMPASDGGLPARQAEL